ncbi:hypothetical protein A2501_04600 [Candidatus Uhrbacteria bacterium RIFOXYC12_FULL_57_11]|nr:MAG: hypothetical protein A2501_04600 [Candidatus Uhrbacteria bacterium RIFOXYC12_FULL_57_11]
MELEKDWLPRLAFRLIIVASVAAILLVVSYVFFPLTQVLSWSVALGSTIFLITLSRRESLVIPKIHRVHMDAGLLFLGLSCAADIILFVLFVMARTDEAIISPWNTFSWQPFVLFGLSTLLLFFGSRMRGDRISLLFAVWHTFVAVSISAVVYGVGFGFDPFLHRAAEEELVRNGFIEPRQILYVGQYLSVAAVHFVSGISIRTIDIWALPLFSSVVIPVGAYLGLRYGWNLSDRDARSWWIVALVQPFMLATFTVPFTWAYVWYLVLLFLIPVVGSSRLAFVSLSLGTISMILFHPLLAVPSFVFVIGFGIWFRVRTRVFLGPAMLALLTAAVACSVPALFVVYQWKQGIGIDFLSLWREGDRFLTLFHSPFSNPYPQIPWFLQAIYGFRYWFPMVCIGVGTTLFLWFARRMDAALPYLAFTAGLLGAILGVSTLFSFRGIISHEQSEFALRLLTAWYLVPLPLIAVAFARIGNRWRASGTVLGTCLCLIVVHAWFFSYPQFNLKYPYFSPSVSAADVEAVHVIEDNADDQSYVVLSNQMTSAAAIQEFHFASYVFVDGEQSLWYAIPTGGPLYAYYSRAIFEGPTRGVFDDLHDHSSVDTIYFVIHDYWPWYPGFVEELFRGADEVLTVHEETIRIFVYRYGY